MNLKTALVAFIFSAILNSVRAANILGLFLTHSPSHAIIHMSIVRALVERGHNVTVITSTRLDVSNCPCRYIFLEHPHFNTIGSKHKLNEEPEEESLYLRSFKFFSTIKKLSIMFQDFTNDPNYIEFIKEENQFDLVILGYLFNDYQLGVAAEFNCPVALSFVVQPFGHLSRLIGNPTNPSFVPLAPFMYTKPMDFRGRVDNFIISTMEWVMSWLTDFNSRRVYNKYFSNDKYPSYSEMKDKISLILFNHHFSEYPIRPLVPGLVEIGGIQIKDKPDPLPKDIETFLNNSSNGAILFSLGTNIRSHDLSAHTLNIIFKVLSSLPYNVICKYDKPDNQTEASNILFKKWLPQDDILAHKNLKLFITHAGKGSVTESEYHGVPMIAVPLMLDQLNNAKLMEEKGHGVKLNYKTMTEDSFREAILNVMEAEKYRNTVQKFSRIYRDRPLTAKENAIFWIEYVIRHKGASHMQSPLKKLNLIQQCSIDVILFLMLIIYLFFKIAKVLIKLLIVISCHFICSFKMTKLKNE